MDRPRAAERGEGAATAGKGAPPRRRNPSLGRLLLTIGVVSAGVYFVFWSAWLWHHLGEERSRTEAAVSRSAERAAATFADFVHEQTAIVADEAASVDPVALARGSCATPLPGNWPIADGHRIGRYDLVRPDGSVVCTTANSHAPPTHNDRGAPWLAAGYKPGTPTSNYHDSRSGRPVWAVAVPVGTSPDTGMLAAVVELRPASSQLGQLLDDGSGAEFLVWDSATGEVLSGPQGSSWGPNDADDRIVDSRVVPTTSWRIAAGVVRSATFAETWSEARWGSVALLASVAALALTTSLVHRRIVRPLVAVTGAAREASEGGTTALATDGPAELADLACAINHLTAARARHEHELTAAADEVTSSLERLDALVANSADMVLIVDADGRITYASPAVATVCGPSARPGVVLTSLVHPDDAPATSALLAPGSTEKGALAELRMGGGGLGWRHVEMVARDLRSHQAVRGFVLNGRDITERLADAEQRAALDAQLHQAQRMESLGALAGGIAHDFKNLLSVILWSTDMAAKDPAAASPGDDLSGIRAAASRGVALAQQLLTFSRRDEAAPEPIDVGAQLLALTDLLRRTLGAHIALELRVDPHLPPVRLNRSRFDQAIVNLAVNARDAMGAGGRLLVEARDHTGTHDGGFDLGRYVVVTVSDTGSGMTPDVAGRAVEPFYSTKEPGHGTGLGLSIVHGIVTAAGGDIRIHSEEHRGTTVRLSFPASVDPTEIERDGVVEEPAPGAGEIVVVVEDDDAVRALVERMLQAGGYTPIGVADPAAALVLAGTADQPIDVVLTDLLMPGMSGAALAGRLGELRPGVPVVFMSAYSSDVLEGLLEAGAAPLVLEKPFTRHQLLDAVHAARTAGDQSPSRWTASNEKAGRQIDT